MAFVVGSDTFNATISGDLRETIERAIRQTEPRVSRALETAARRVFRDALEDWPVAKGRRSKDSRGKLYWDLRFVPPSRLEVVFGNRSPYTWYIRGDRQGGRHTWTQLIRKPLRSVKFRRRLLDEIGDELVGAM